MHFAVERATLFIGLELTSEERSIIRDTLMGMMCRDYEKRFSIEQAIESFRQIDVAHLVRAIEAQPCKVISSPAPVSADESGKEKIKLTRKTVVEHSKFFSQKGSQIIEPVDQKVEEPSTALGI